jgi:hypothetical protein
MVDSGRGLQSREFVIVTVFKPARHWRGYGGVSWRKVGGSGTTQALDGLSEANALSELDEANGVAPDITAKAMPGTRVCPDIKVGSTAIGMERTASDRGAALSTEFDAVTSDDIMDWIRVFQRVDVNALGAARIR